jgi:hypothetical protein
MYITVLPSDLTSDPWVAVQWNNDLAALMGNNSYRADVSQTFPRSGGDQLKPGTKSITEQLTGDVVDDARVVALAGGGAKAALAAGEVEAAGGAAKAAPAVTKGATVNHHRKKKRSI